MPKPKDELMDLSKICGATHAKGAILEIEAEIKFHRGEIFKIWEPLKEQVGFKPFAGFSPSKVKELTDEIGGHFWCVEKYREQIEAIKTQFGV